MGRLARGAPFVCQTGSGVIAGRIAVVGGNLQLSWPADHKGWRLQAQTNSLATGLNAASGAWTTVAGSTATNQVSLPINPVNGNVFFRLIYP